MFDARVMENRLRRRVRKRKLERAIVIINIY